MSIFDTLFPFTHSNMAMNLKNHAVSADINSAERDLIKRLNVEQFKYVGERVFFLGSFIRSCLIHLGEAQPTPQGNKIVQMARHDYDSYMEKYFGSLPGVDKSKALKAYSDAQHRYGLIDKETLYMTFLAHATHNHTQNTPSISADVSNETMLLLGNVMDSYTKGSIDLIQRLLSRINPVTYK